MRQVHKSQMLAEIAFADKAGAHFAANAKHYSFTDGDIKPGALLAIRWGLGEDCVLVLKLDEEFEPTIYAQQIRLATQP